MDCYKKVTEEVVKIVKMLKNEPLDETAMAQHFEKAVKFFFHRWKFLSISYVGNT